MNFQTRLDSVSEGIDDGLIEAAQKGISHHVDSLDNVVVRTPGAAYSVDLVRDIPESYLRVLMKNVSSKGFAGLKVVDAIGQEIAFLNPAECARIAELP